MGGCGLFGQTDVALPLQQIGQWEFFKTHWDEAQATENGVNWGTVFAESIHCVLRKLLHGESDALSEFVKNETDRVLRDKGALVVPGFPTQTDIGQGSC